MALCSIICLILALLLFRARPGQRAVTCSVTVNDRMSTLSVRPATSWMQRQVGLLNHQNLEVGEGLYLSPSRQIHTVGMAFSLDIVFLNRHGLIVDLVCDVPPGRKHIKGPRGTRSVLEFRSGTIGSQVPLKAGDRLSLANNI